MIVYFFNLNGLVSENWLEPVPYSFLMMTSTSNGGGGALLFGCRLTVALDSDFFRAPLGRNEVLGIVARSVK